MTWLPTETARCAGGSFIACAFRDDGRRVDAKCANEADALAAAERRKHDA